jgi:hypothetical protein
MNNNSVTNVTVRNDDLQHDIESHLAIERNKQMIIQEQRMHRPANTEKAYVLKQKEWKV